MSAVPPSLAQRSCDFALIGHMESWSQATGMMRALRPPDKGEVPEAEIRGIFPWIPARPVFRIAAHSILPGIRADGVYIDTFIAPEDLTARTLRQNIRKVQKAAHSAQREGARVVTLGGFTSIVLEGNTSLLDLADPAPAFTTGNTLTVALIVKGIEEAAAARGLDLAQARLLVLGATGDLGTGCVRYFAGRLGGIDLCARNQRRLQRLAGTLEAQGQPTRYSADANSLLPDADLVIAVASLATPEFDTAQCKDGAVICDAGYPKNVRPAPEKNCLYYYGGMGQITGGVSFVPDLTAEIYQYPQPGIGHACLLEAVLLAFEQRFEPFSVGKGNIGREKVDEIWAMAQKHGVQLAPFFNHTGIVNPQIH